MAFVGSLSGSTAHPGGKSSVLGISGSLVIADREESLYPSIVSNVKLFVSGWMADSESSAPGGTNALVLGGDTVVSGNLVIDAQSDTGSPPGIAVGYDAAQGLWQRSHMGVLNYFSGTNSQFQTSENGGAWTLFGGDLAISGAMRVGMGYGSSTGGTISGSIHETADGKSYLVAGSNITITSASNGQINIASTGGGGGGISFNGSTANGMVTYGGASTADVESTLTYDGTDMLIAAAGKVQFRDTGISLSSTEDGSLTISSDGTAEDAIILSAIGAGAGMDVNVGTGGYNNTGGGHFAVTSSMNHQHAIQLFASAGGIDINAAGAAGEDIDIKTTGGSINITASEDAADAIVLTAGNGGIDLTAGGAAGEDIDITNSAGSVNISGGETAADSVKVQGTGVQILASNTTHGLKLGTGTASVPVTIGHSTSEVTVADNLTVTGDLTVNGDTTTIHTTNLHVKDPFVLLGDEAQAANANSGIVFVSGSSTGATRPDVVFARVSNDIWGLGSIASNSGSITSATAMVGDIGFVAASITGSATVTSPQYTSTAAMDISSTGALTIDSVGTDNVSIATENAGKTVQIGNAGSTALNLDGTAITLTSVNALSLTDGTGTIELGGTGALATSAVTTMDLQTTSNITIDSSAGTIGIGTDDVDQNINIGTHASAARTIALGSTGATAVNLTGAAIGLTGAVALTGNILPAADSTYNLGSESFRFANVYTGDLHLRNERGNWTMIEEPTYLSLTNNDTGKVYRLLMEEVEDDSSPDSPENETVPSKRSSRKKRSL